MFAVPVEVVWLHRLMKWWVLAGPWSNDFSGPGEATCCGAWWCVTSSWSWDAKIPSMQYVLGVSDMIDMCELVSSKWSFWGDLELSCNVEVALRRVMLRNLQESPALVWNVIEMCATFCRVLFNTNAANVVYQGLQNSCLEAWRGKKQLHKPPRLGLGAFSFWLLNQINSSGMREFLCQASRQATWPTSLGWSLWPGHLDSACAASVSVWIGFRKAWHWHLSRRYNQLYCVYDYIYIYLFKKHTDVQQKYVHTYYIHSIWRFNWCWCQGHHGRCRPKQFQKLAPAKRHANMTSAGKSCRLHYLHLTWTKKEIKWKTCHWGVWDPKSQIIWIICTRFSVLFMPCIDTLH